jgi:hypothetical protein
VLKKVKSMMAMQGGAWGPQDVPLIFDIIKMKVFYLIRFMGDSRRMICREK